ncbi:hypothetical protein WJX72_012470 [[Myrmecia] bisecta]|uniref:TFIIS N-terminal domain-containing protein n=1 Tax=[Myrmecia] bisecta TaxID=41462 RepID=A0AAW1PKZ0_9CHLO
MASGDYDGQAPAEDETDRRRMAAELFGDSDSEDETPARSVPAPAATSKKQRLADLAQKKRREAEEEQEEAPARKRPHTEAGRPDTEAAELRERPQSGTEGVESDEDVVPVRTAEDDAFIDDADAEPGERYGSEDDEEEQARLADEGEAEEAGEEDEFERMFASKGKRRRSGQSSQDVKAQVESFLARMEVAAELDIEANSSSPPAPAIHKLRLLPELETVLSQRALYQECMDGGVLGVLKAWIEPMPDGSLPNIKVRSAVLRLLQQLPVDISDEGRKEQLKKSGLGKVVMFLFKLPDETPANRRIAKELVEKWSRPIFEAQRERANPEELHARELEARRRRLAQQRQQAAGEAEAGADPTQRRVARPGDANFRWHASIPQPARLDYVRRPDSQVQPAEGSNARKPPKNDKMAKRLKTLGRKGASVKAAKVSVEGRGLII